MRTGIAGAEFRRRKNKGGRRADKQRPSVLFSVVQRLSFTILYVMTKV